ncbi:MAG: four helix bundle protein [Balneolaceae bacterium]|jgi:four helix bundle protein
MVLLKSDNKYFVYVGFKSKKMIVWKKGPELIKEVYQITGKLPEQEKFGFVSRLRRVAVSVVSNISEAEARRTNKEKRRY